MKRYQITSNTPYLGLNLLCLAILLSFSLQVLSITNSVQNRSQNSDPVKSQQGQIRNIAFTNVSVVPITTNEVLANHTVVIQDGKIRKIGPAGEIKIPKGTRTINGNRKFLAPGLADMHVHLMEPNQARMMVNYGVTTVRNMGVCPRKGSIPSTLELIKQVNQGEFLGPRILTAGPIIDGSPKIWFESVEIQSVDEGISEVRRQFEVPYDFIKVYSMLSPYTFFGIAKEANRLGMPFAGHVPESMTIHEAVKAGMRTMEHMIGFDSGTLAKGITLGPYGSAQRAQIGLDIKNGVLSPEEVFDSKKLLALADEVSKSNTWVVPTLSIFKGLMKSHKAKKRALRKSKIAYVTPLILDTWDPAKDIRVSWMSEKQLAGQRVLDHLNMERLKKLSDAGVKLLIGTDTPNPFVFDGLSVHTEMGLFVKAGVPTYETIRAATIGPAHSIDEQGKWGEVIEGARADLVLLKDNPLEDIKHYRNIVGVVLNGLWLDRSKLKEMKAEVAADYAKGRQTILEKPPGLYLCAH